MIWVEVVEEFRIKAKVWNANSFRNIFQKKREKFLPSLREYNIL